VSKHSVTEQVQFEIAAVAGTTRTGYDWLRLVTTGYDWLRLVTTSIVGIVNSHLP